MRVLKYISSGIFVAAFQLIVFSVLSRYAPYLLASSYAFVLAVIVSFLLQKYWTFRNKNRRMSGQFLFFLSNSLWGLLLNGVFMWVLVEKLFFYTQIAQVFTMIFLATYNYFIYKIIFKHKAEVLGSVGNVNL